MSQGPPPANSFGYNVNTTFVPNTDEVVPAMPHQMQPGAPQGAPAWAPASQGAWGSGSGRYAPPGAAHPPQMMQQPGQPHMALAFTGEAKGSSFGLLLSVGNCQRTRFWLLVCFPEGPCGKHA